MAIVVCSDLAFCFSISYFSPIFDSKNDAEARQYAESLKVYFYVIFLCVVEIML